MTLEIAMEPPNVIEEGVLNGRFNLGIVPLHRHSPLLQYHELYSETMRLYCGRGHPLFNDPGEDGDLAALRRHSYAGLGFNSPNMAIHQKLKLRKSAFVQDEEALVLLILSGRYLGFLPTHMARPFLVSGMIREIGNSTAGYTSRMAAIVRKSSASGRRLTTFVGMLTAAHA